MGIERAIFVVRLKDLRHVGKSCSRLYFGHEFCERRLPSVKDLQEALFFARKRCLDFTLVTPYVTSAGLRKVGALLRVLSRKHKGAEVVINDFGTLNLLNREHGALIPVVGRLLTKQKRSPEIGRVLARNVAPRWTVHPDDAGRKILLLQNKMPLEMDLYYKGSNVSSVPVLQDFLLQNRVGRIELDNLVQGLHLELPQDKLTASVYVPYVYITTTFFCPTAGCDEKQKTFLKLRPCRQPCQKYVFALRHPAMPHMIYLRGNTQFYKNPKIHVRQWQKMGVSRLVFQPQIPV